jgi:hypothetical protein
LLSAKWIFLKSSAPGMDLAPSTLLQVEIAHGCDTAYCWQRESTVIVMTTYGYFVLCCRTSMSRAVEHSSFRLPARKAQAGEYVLVVAGAAESMLNVGAPQPSDQKSEGGTPLSPDHTECESLAVRFEHRYTHRKWNEFVPISIPRDVGKVVSVGRKEDNTWVVRGKCKAATSGGGVFGPMPRHAFFLTVTDEGVVVRPVGTELTTPHRGTTPHHSNKEMQKPAYVLALNHCTSWAEVTSAGTVLTHRCVLHVGGKLFVFMRVDTTQQIPQSLSCYDMERRHEHCPQSITVIPPPFAGTALKSTTAGWTAPTIYFPCGHAIASRPGLPTTCPVCVKSKLVSGEGLCQGNTLTQMRFDTCAGVPYSSHIVDLSSTPTVAMNPCGHAVGVSDAVRWAKVVVPPFATIPHAICWICGSQLNQDHPFSTIRYATEDDERFN